MSRTARAWAGVAAGLVVVASLLPGVASAAHLGPARVYVAHRTSGTVTVIDLGANAAIGTIAVGDQPSALTMAPDGTRVYVANEGSGTVSVIDTSTNAVISTVPVGTRPTGLRVGPDGREMWVAALGSSAVSIVDTGTNAAVGVVAVGAAQHGVAFSPDGSRAYLALANGRLAVVDVASRTVVATLPAGHAPHTIEVTGDGSKIYVADSVNSVRVIDAAALTVVATVSIGRPPESLAAHPDGTRVYAGTSGFVAVLDTGSHAVTDKVLLDNPRTVAISRTGERLYVTTHAGRVAVLDPTTFRAVVDSVPVAGDPVGLVVGQQFNPTFGGSTWYSGGVTSRTGPAGSTVSLHAVGAAPGVAHRLAISRGPTCADLVAFANPATVVAGANGMIGTVRGTVPAATPAGTYWLCFRHTAGATATGAVGFTVS